MKNAKVEQNTYFPSGKYLTGLKAQRGRLSGGTVFVLLALYSNWQKMVWWYMCVWLWHQCHGPCLMFQHHNTQHQL